jgi:hypothetical protein
VFENRVLSIIFGPKEEEGVGGWRSLHNEELHNVYVSPNIISVIKSRRMRWVQHVACTGEMNYVCQINVRRPRRRWEGNITTDLRETGWEVMNCIDLAQDRVQCLALVNTVMNLRVPKKVRRVFIS